MECGGGNYEVRLGEGVAGLAAILDQEPPPEHDVFSDVKDPLHRVHEPIVQFGSLLDIGNKFDAEADLSEGYHADVKQIEWLRRDECDHLRFWPSAPQLLEDVGVE